MALEKVEGVSVALVDKGITVKCSANSKEILGENGKVKALLLDDGKIRLICVGNTGEGADRRLVCRVVSGGTVTSRKGLNLPDSDLTVPTLTEKDQRCVEFAVQKDFDYLALSFVRSSGDVRARCSETG